MCFLVLFKKLVNYKDMSPTAGKVGAGAGWGSGNPGWHAQVRAGVVMSGSVGCRKQQHSPAKPIGFAER